MGAFGLQTHIWNNNLKSAFLLAGFPVLLIFLIFGLAVGYVGLTEPVPDTGAGLRLAGGAPTSRWTPSVANVDPNAPPTPSGAANRIGFMSEDRS